MMQIILFKRFTIGDCGSRGNFEEDGYFVEEGREDN